MKKDDIPALTGLRFFAAAAIVFDHLWPVIFKLNPAVPLADPFHQLAFLGMSLFFVLSGFIIHYNYSEVIGSMRGLYRFGVARFSRLYPLFIALVAYDLVCGNFFLYQPTQQVQFIDALPYMVTATQSWFYGFLGNSPIAFPYHFSDVTWSISTEFFLYLTYPALCFLMLRAAGARRAIILAIGTTLLATVVLSFLKSHTALIDQISMRFGVVENPAASAGMRFSDWFTYIAPYPRVLEFASGCALAQLYVRIAAYKPSKWEQRIAGTIFGVAVLDIATFLLRGELGAPMLARAVGAVGLLPSICVLIFCCARYELAAVKALSGARIVALGDASYSMYLLHLIVIEKSAPTMFVDATPLNIAVLAGRMVIILGAIAVLSLGTHRYFEMPTQKWLRKRLLPHRSVVLVHDDRATSSIHASSRR